MQLPSRSFSQFLQDSAAIIQGSTIGLIDLSAGSVLRSVLEANASVALWIQWLILRLLQATRAATSVGNDLDSWMQDFSVVRLPATPAVGQVSFSRLSSTTPALIPIGTLVTTGDNSHTFE